MSWGSAVGELSPDAAPSWLKPLTDNCRDVKRAYRRRVPPEVLALVTAANTKAAVTGEKRDAAVLVLFSGPADSASGGLPDDADLLVTVRASTLRHHAGQAAFPGGAADPGTADPCTPRCARPTRRRASTPAGCSRCARWSGCSSRRLGSTSFRFWHIHRIRGRWP